MVKGRRPIGREAEEVRDFGVPKVRGCAEGRKPKLCGLARDAEEDCGDSLLDMIHDVEEA